MKQRRNMSLHALRQTLLGMLWLTTILLVGLAPPPARAQSDDYSPNALRSHRLELLVRAGQDGLKPLEPAIFHFATESEHCRVTYGSKACGLSLDSLEGGGAEQVFEYYIKQPAQSGVGQQQPTIQREDWNWAPSSTQGNQPAQSGGGQQQPSVHREDWNWAPTSRPGSPPALQRR